MRHLVAALAVLMLVAGLLIGVGIGLTLFAKTLTITETKYPTITTIITPTKGLVGTETMTLTPPPTPIITGATTLTTTITMTTTEIIMKTIAHEDIEYVCFSRVDNCSLIIIKLIDSAEKYVHVAVYSFTLDVLRDALIRAKGRGVDVKVVIEKEQSRVQGSEYENLLKAGVNVKLDGNPATMHHKFVVVDGKIMVTGSYNWSYSAEEKNDENLIVISNPDIAKFYEAEFNRIWNQAS
jgi:phosphatidylserine/phosphatidylglycerophosphate/cardiolipin synthase-like enzyme